MPDRQPPDSRDVATPADPARSPATVERRPPHPIMDNPMPGATTIQTDETLGPDYDPTISGPPAPPKGVDRS